LKVVKTAYLAGGCCEMPLLATDYTDDDVSLPASASGKTIIWI
jgi:hypothetical protein